MGGENLSHTPTYLLFQILLQPSQHEAKRESSNSALRHFSHQAKTFLILSDNSLIFRIARVILPAISASNQTPGKPVVRSCQQKLRQEGGKAMTMFGGVQ